jgi:hypothetical protein
MGLDTGSLVLIVFDYNHRGLMKACLVKARSTTEVLLQTNVVIALGRGHTPNWKTSPQEEQALPVS